MVDATLDRLVVPTVPARLIGDRAYDRYRRRWKMERLLAWLQNNRWLVTRYERHAENFLAFVQLGCLMILLRAFMR